MEKIASRKTGLPPRAVGGLWYCGVWYKATWNVQLTPGSRICQVTQAGSYCHLQAPFSVALGFKDRDFHYQAVSCELGLKETNPLTGDTQHREYGVVSPMAGQMPVVVEVPLRPTAP